MRPKKKEKREQPITIKILTYMLLVQAAGCIYTALEIASKIPIYHLGLITLYGICIFIIFSTVLGWVRRQYE